MCSLTTHKKSCLMQQPIFIVTVSMDVRPLFMGQIFHSEKSDLTVCVLENINSWVHRKFLNGLTFPSYAAKSDIRAFC